ncbi:hypothetical protein B7H01_01370 [Pandoraea apista]|nr:hypothetical protein SG18_02020 [Pandoraea apista]AKH71211.1 hypothetical protein XM39_02020 [Pandoraea apista]AKI63483.1 hypothetical protein AA956_19340 [Pandoraea apista]OXS97675.1 hypothetical protein B7H01_01370 [Pandoraea apista]PTD99302.1 hypothetical protein C7830_19640 [Pandoraea apista]
MGELAYSAAACIVGLHAKPLMPLVPLVEAFERCRLTPPLASLAAWRYPEAFDNADPVRRDVAV